jgi:hypothetical protein
LRVLTKQHGFGAKQPNVDQRGLIYKIIKSIEVGVPDLGPISNPKTKAKSKSKKEDEESEEPEESDDEDAADLEALRQVAPHEQVEMLKDSNRAKSAAKTSTVKCLFCF